MTERGAYRGQPAPLKVSLQHQVVADDAVYGLDFVPGSVTDDLFLVELGAAGLMGKASLEGDNRVPETVEAIGTFVLQALQAAGGVAARLASGPSNQMQDLEDLAESYKQAVAAEIATIKADINMKKTHLSARQKELAKLDDDLQITLKTKVVEDLTARLDALREVDSPGDNLQTHLLEISRELRGLREALADAALRTAPVAQAINQLQQRITTSQAKVTSLTPQAGVWKRRAQRLRAWFAALEASATALDSSGGLPAGFSELRALIAAHLQALRAMEKPPTEFNATDPTNDDNDLAPESLLQRERLLTGQLADIALGLVGGDTVLYEASASVAASPSAAAADAQREAMNRNPGERLYYVIID